MWLLIESVNSIFYFSILQVVSNLDETFKGSDYTTLMWFPFSGRCAVQDMDKVPANTPTNPPPSAMFMKTIFLLQDLAYLIGYVLLL